MALLRLRRETPPPKSPWVDLGVLLFLIVGVPVLLTISRVLRSVLWDLATLTLIVAVIVGWVAWKRRG